MIRGIIKLLVVLVMIIQTFPLKTYAQEHLGSIKEQQILESNSIQAVAVDEKSILQRLESKSPNIRLPYLGHQKEFEVKAFSIYGDEKNPFPEIKTYKIYDRIHGVTGRITTGPIGINIIYLKDGKMVRVYNPEPAKKSERTYVQEIGISPTEKALHFCTQHEGFDIDSPEDHKLDHAHADLAHSKRNGSLKRRYRAAIICTGEYYNANGGGATAVRNLMIANLNDVSAIFEVELAVEMYMATGSPRLEQDIANDPFDPSFGSRTQQAQNAVSSAFPLSRYDVGHVFHTHSSGDGWDTGGVAGLGVVCNDNRKASGWSGSFNNTSNGWIQLAAHEFGHMYNATHTYNGSGDSACTPNITSSTSYEIGSGTTIMSYNGLCDSEQNIPGSGVADNYFHINSLERMVNYLETSALCNEINWESDLNQEPTVNANPCDALYIIPRSTPFMLTGEASDPDDDFLTYCWEQYDEDGFGTPSIGLIGQNAAFYNGACPLFRSFPPTANPTRYFPRLDNLAANNNSDFEALPRRSRSMRFRLTARDNNTESGGIDWDEVIVNVRNSGPLSVQAPTPGTIIQAGTTMDVTWDTNTRAQDGTICEKAVIKLSTDGGLTFPLILAEDVDYESGMATVNVPASYPNTESARVMVACDDYECFAFFDINNGNFTIESNCFAPANLLCDDTEEEFDFGDQELNLDLNAIQGTSFNSLLGSIEDILSTLPTMSPAVNNNTGTCTRINSINNPYLETRFSVTEPGTYTFTINNNINDNVTAYTIFDGDSFDPLDACSSFIESNAEFSNGNYSFGISFNATLVACKEYVLASQVTNSSSLNLAISEISGPGTVIRSENIDDYELTYLAIDQTTNEIIAQSPDSDFRSLPVGNYNIVASYYKARGIAPPADVNPDNWVGQTTGDILGSLDCFRISNNEKPITVNQSCFVFDIEPGLQTACDPATNTYEQTLSFKIDMGPGTGTVNINGQIFDLDGDELTVTLTDLVANGRPVDLEFSFSDDVGCDGFFEEVFVSPANCCPIDIDLGEDTVYCEGEMVQLDAGSEATAYKWFRDGEELSEAGQFLDVSLPGLYLAQVTHSSGCINEDEVLIEFEALPEIVFDQNEVLACDGDLVVVNASIDISDRDILWQRDGEDLPNTGSSIEVTQSGVYELFVTSPNNCVSSLSFNADFAGSPDVDLGPDILTCDGSVITLDAGDEGVEYIWRRNAFQIPGDESTNEIDGFGVYSVEVINANGCIDRDTIEIDYEPLPEYDFGRDVTRCFGNFYTIEAEPSAFEIAWYKDGELLPGENEIELTPLESGEYVGQIFLNEQCIEDDTIVINYLDVPDLEFPELISACPGEEIELLVDDPDASVNWSSESMGDIADNVNSITVTENDIIYIEARSTTTFCVIRDTVNIQFTDIPVIDLGSDINVCEGEDLVIGSPTEGFLAQWFLNDVLIPGETGEELAVSAPGEYRMRIESGDDCISEDVVMVNFFPAPEVELGDDISTCPGELVLLEAGDAANNFQWQKDGEDLNNDSNTLEVTESGIYSVTVTNPGDCSTIDMIEVNFTELPALDLGSDIDRCEGDIYMIDADAQGFVVEWFFNGELVQGQSGDIIEAPESGEYIARVNAGENCSIADTILVSYFPFPDIELGDDKSACPGDIVMLDLNNDNYTFKWSGATTGDIAENGNSLEVEETDTYFVEVSNEAGCISRDTVTVSFVDLPDLDLGTDTELCAGEEILLSSPSNGFDVEWYKDGELLQGESSDDLMVKESGEYIMRISANQDCSISDTVNISFIDLPIVELGEDRSACPGDIIMLDAGDPANNYVWSSLSGGDLMNNSNMLSVNETDIYYVEVSNSAGCISRDTLEISFVELPVLNLGDDINDLCVGDELILDANAGSFDIEWQLDGMILTGENDNLLSVTESGTYTLIVSGGDNCNVMEEIEVSFNELPEISMLQDQVACEGETLVLSAGNDGEFQYIWRDQDEMILQDGDMASFTVSETGTYSVEAIDENGCSESSQAEISFIAAPMVELDESLSFCEGSEELITAVSNVSVVEWYRNDILIMNETSTELNVSEAGTYIAVVGPGTQCEDRDTIIVETILAPSIDFLSDNSICEDQLPYLLEINTDQQADIQWFENGMEISGANSTSLEVSQAGIYSVELTNADNCTSSDEFNIDVVPLSNNQLSAVPELCEGESFTMEVTSNGQRFEWLMDGEIITGATQLELDISEAGLYSFIGYNELNCPSISEFEVIVNPLPDADLGEEMIMACEGDIITLNVADSQGNDYLWRKDGQAISGETTASLNINESGQYSIEVTNSFGCIDTDELTAVFNTPPNLDLEGDAEFCQGASVELSVNTNTSLIQWSLNGQVIAQNTSTVEVSEAGIYLITAESIEGCQVSDEIEVTENMIPSINIDNIELCPGEMQNISLPAGFEEYIWTGIMATGNQVTLDYQSVDTPTTISATATIIDDNGCSSTDEFELSYLPELNAEILSSNISICEGETAQLEVSGGLYYDWTDPAGSLSSTNISNPVASPVSSTSYTVEVTDDCPNNFASFDINVNVNPPPLADAGADTCTIAGADLELTASGGLQYIWNNPDLIVGSSTSQTVIVNVEEDTSFVVTVIDENQCQSQDSIQVCILEDPFQVLQAVTLITPNGDFSNDVLEFNGLEAFPENKLTVFNRWGNIIFRKTNYQTDAIRWDGTRDGEPLPADTYYYILEFSTFKIKKSITLLRD